MTKFQKIKNLLFGLLLTAFAVILLLIPESSYDAAAAVIGLFLFIYSLRLLWYYFRMARHMVGGKAILYQGLIVLDLSLFTGSMATMNSFVLIFYLFGIFAFSGFVDILRSFESKKLGASSWKFRIISGAVGLLFSIVMLITGVIIGNRDILVYGFCISLVYSGIRRIISAFRKTAIVYIQ